MLLLIVNYFKLNHFFFFILCRGKLNLASSVEDPHFLGLLDPNPLVTSPDPAPDPFLSHKGVE